MKYLNFWVTLLMVWCLGVSAQAQLNCFSPSEPTDAIFNLDQPGAMPGAATVVAGVNIVPLGVAVNDSAVYEFTAVEDGYFTVSSCNNLNDQDTRLSLVRLVNGVCGNYKVIASSDNDCGLAAMINDVKVEEDSVYALIWDNKSGAAITFDFSFEFVDDAYYNANRPATDNVCNAAWLKMDVDSADQSNEFASVEILKDEYQVPYLSFDLDTRYGWYVDTNVANTVWYKFIAPATGAVQIDVESSEFNVQFALFASNSYNCANDITDLSIVRQIDQNDGGVETHRNYCLTPGATYYIAVDGFGTESGEFDILVSELNLSRPLSIVMDIDTLDDVYHCDDNAYFQIGFELVNAKGDSLKYTTTNVASANYNAATADDTVWDYAKSLTITLSKDGKAADTLVGTTSFMDDFTIGSYVFNITDTCGTVYSKTFVLTPDTVVDPLVTTLEKLNDPYCVNANTGRIRLTTSGGYKWITREQRENSTPGMYPLANDYFIVGRKKAETAAFSTTIAPGLPQVGDFIVSDTSTLSQLDAGAYTFFVVDACGLQSKVEGKDLTVDTVRLTNPDFAVVEAHFVEEVDPICPASATGIMEVRATGGQGMPLRYQWQYATKAGNWLVPGDDTTGAVWNVLHADTIQRLEMESQGVYRVIVDDRCQNIPSINEDTAWFNLSDPIKDTLRVALTHTDPSAYNVADGTANLTIVGGNTMDYIIRWSVDGKAYPAWNDVANPTTIPQGKVSISVQDRCDTLSMLNIYNWDTLYYNLAPLANDSVCNAIPVTSKDTLTTYHNRGAGVQTGENGLVIPQTFGDNSYDGWDENNINQSVWFSFVAPQSGAVSIEALHCKYYTSGLNFDPQIAVFSGDCDDFTSLNLEAANDDGYNRTGNMINDPYLEVFCLTPGETYYILVDGFQDGGSIGSQEGVFNLIVEDIDLNAVNFNVTASNPTCNSNGMATFTGNIIGGVYRNITDLPNKYLYTVTVSRPDKDTVINNVTSNGTLLSSTTNVEDFLDNLTPGDYSVSVEDVCGSVTTKNFTIDPYVFKPFEIDTVLTNVTCPGGNDGRLLVVSAEGGTPGQYIVTDVNDDLIGFGGLGLFYHYQGVGFDSVIIGGFADGVYQINIADGCGNVKQINAEFTDPILDTIDASFEVIAPSCPQTTDGQVVITMTGGSKKAVVDVYNVASGILIWSGTVTGTDTVKNLGLTTSAQELYKFVYTDYCYTGAHPKKYIDSAFVTVVDPNAPAVVIVVDTIVYPTFGNADGSFKFHITGGYPGYDVQVRTKASNGQFDIVVPFTQAGGIYTVATLDSATYRVSVHDECHNSGGSSDTEILNLYYQPGNNLACNAYTLMDSVVVEGTNVRADDINEGFTGLNGACDVAWCLDNGDVAAGVWYTYTVPTSPNGVSVTVDVEAIGGEDFQVAVFSTDDCANINAYTLLAANDERTAGNDDPRVVVGCQPAGTVLYILVDGWKNDQGKFKIFADAKELEELTILNNVVKPSTETAADGEIFITAMGGVAPYTYVWADTPLETGRVRRNLTAGEYTVTVTDKCGTVKSFILDLGQAGVSNDKPCNAISLPLDGMFRQYNNIGSTLDAGEENIQPKLSTDCFAQDTTWCKKGVNDNTALDGTVWFSFVAPQSGSVKVDLTNNLNNDIDAQVAVYEANLCGNFTTYKLVGANDDARSGGLGSLLDLTNLNPCFEYLVMVDSYNAQKGNFGIAVSDLDATGINTGNDTIVNVCNTSNTFDLKTILAAGADQDGTFNDNDAAGTLVGSVVTVKDLTPGTYSFDYVKNAVYCTTEKREKTVTITIVVENCVGISRNETAEEFFSIYPNPSNGVFNLMNVGEAKTVGVVVTDLAGKAVYTSSVELNKNEASKVDLGSVATGIYTVKLTSGNNSPEIHRIVVD